MSKAQGGLSPIAARRIQCELAEWGIDPPERWSLHLNDDVLKQWVLELRGTEAYEGEVFRLLVTFSPNYPMESPDFKFLEPAPLHPHIYSNGHVCLDILYDAGAHASWSPALTIASVCRSLLSMLAANHEKVRPAGDEDYVKRVGSQSAKKTRWAFHDEKV